MIWICNDSANGLRKRFEAFKGEHCRTGRILPRMAYALVDMLSLQRSRCGYMMDKITVRACFGDWGFQRSHTSDRIAAHVLIAER